MSSHAGEVARTDHEVFSVSRPDAEMPAVGRTPGIGWLVRLRWLALAGQLLAYAVEAPHNTPNHRLILGLVVLCTAVSNVALWRVPNQMAVVATRFANSKYVLTGGVLTLDCFLLTVWLGIAGATTNPFSVLYLVHIVLGAVVLDTRWTTWLNLFAVVCYGSLFLLPSQACCTPEFDGVESAYLSHMQGMWFAFIVAAILTSYFVRQLTVEAERRRQLIEELQLSAQRSAHMASLTTLAAGTAHELRTPLATISVAAHELHCTALRLGNKDVVDDAELIAVEVDRCQEILAGMGPRLLAAGDHAAVVLASKVSAVLAAEYAARDEAQPRVVFVNRAEGSVRVVVDDLLTALRCIINNALDATEEGGSVTVTTGGDATTVSWIVIDTGVGMTNEVEKRALEPFFSTKAPGRGVGLGLFVAQAFAFQNGGRLELESVLGRGTTVRLTLQASTGTNAHA
jgi:two-component system, sensor histidine kinase RegB